MQGFHILFALLCGKYQKNLQDGLVGNLQRGTLSIKKTIAATSIASGPPDAVQIPHGDLVFYGCLVYVHLNHPKTGFTYKLIVPLFVFVHIYIYIYIWVYPCIFGHTAIVTSMDLLSCLLLFRSTALWVNARAHFKVEGVSALHCSKQLALFSIHPRCRLGECLILLTHVFFNI